jgi:hypothetical protein
VGTERGPGPWRLPTLKDPTCLLWRADPELLWGAACKPYPDTTRMELPRFLAYFAPELYQPVRYFFEGAADETAATDHVTLQDYQVGC